MYMYNVHVLQMYVCTCTRDVCVRRCTCMYMYSRCRTQRELYKIYNNSLFFYDVIFIIRFFRKYQNKTNLKNGQKRQRQKLSSSKLIYLYNYMKQSCLSVCLLVHLSVCLLVCLSVCLLVHLSVCLSIPWFSLNLHTLPRSFLHLQISAIEYHCILYIDRQQLVVSFLLQFDCSRLFVGHDFGFKMAEQYRYRDRNNARLTQQKGNMR